MTGNVEPTPGTSPARWALALARSEGTIPADYEDVSEGGDTRLRWRSPVASGGYDEIEITEDGHTFYRLDGKLHRLDGPAVVHVTQHRWFVLGREYPDRRSWYYAAVLAALGLPHLNEYVEAALHTELNPAEAAAGYHHGVPVDELRADRAMIGYLD